MQKPQKGFTNKKLLLQIIHIILTIFLLIENTLAKKQLKFLFEMFRHGARSPLELDSESKDIFGHKWNAKGELTPVGMRMHFLLGFRNSEVYGKPLNISNYSTSQISISSTDVNRTILSAYSQLQGFFPPLTGPQLNSAAKLQKAFPPIQYDFSVELSFLKDNALREQANIFAIRTLNKQDHGFYLHDADVCEGVKAKVSAAKQSEKVQSFVKRFNADYAQKLYKALNITEQPSFNLTQVETLQMLFDTYNCGYTDGRKYPALLAQNINVSEFYNLASDFLKMDMFDIAISDDYTGLYSMSPLFKKILNYMDRRIQSELNNMNTNKDSEELYSAKDPKIAMVSGHDTNLAAFMRFVKAVFNRTQLVNPTFASSVYIELLYDSEVISDVPLDKFFVNVLINDENLFGETLSYKYFSEQVRSRLVSSDEIAKFCNFAVVQSSSAEIFLFIAVVGFGVIASALFVWFMAILLIKRNKESEDINNEEGFRPVVPRDEV